MTATLVGAFLAPPDPFTQPVRWLRTFVPLRPAAYLVVYRRGCRRLPIVGST